MFGNIYRIDFRTISVIGYSKRNKKIHVLLFDIAREYDQMTQNNDKYKSDKKKHVSKALLILSTFDESSPMQRTTDVASKLDMNMSTVSRHLNSLLDLGFLDRDDVTGQYFLGIEMIALTGAALHNNDLYRHAYPELQQLSFKYEIHSHMAVPSDVNVIHLISTSCEKNMELLIPMGHSHPMYCSAMGRAILAFQSDNEIDRILKKSDLRKYTSETKTKVPEIMQSLNKAKKLGYSTVINELDEGTASIASPIFNRKRKPVGAISVSASVRRIQRDNEEKILAKAVVTTAGRISAKLGYFPK